MNRIVLFDEGDSVKYNHPVFGEGRGIVAGKDILRNEIYVYPKKKIKGEEFLTLNSELIILTPF